MSQICPICWSDIDKATDTFTTSCNHVFCTKCLFTWLRHKDRHFIKPADNGTLRGSCPTCRQEIQMIVYSRNNRRDFDIKGGIVNYFLLRILRGTGVSFKIKPMLIL